jgi:hypothetical protein
MLSAKLHPWSWFFMLWHAWLPFHTTIVTRHCVTETKYSQMIKQCFPLTHTAQICTKKFITEVTNAWHSKSAQKPCRPLQKTDLYVKMCYTLTMQVTQGWHQLTHVVAHCSFFVFITLLAYKWEQHWPSHTATKKISSSHTQALAL